MGLQVTRLESNTALPTDEASHRQKALEACLQSITKGSPEKSIDAESLSKRENSLSMEDGKHVATMWGLDKSKVQEKKGIQSLGKVLKGPFSGCKQPSSGNGKEKQTCSSLPRYSDLDPSVLAYLPPDIIAELDAVYNGALTQRLKSSEKLQGLKTTSCIIERPPAQLQEPVAPIPQKTDAIILHRENEECSGALPSVISIPKRESSNLVKGAQTSYAGTRQANSELSAPISLSQVDIAVLEDLPLELREDILRSLPPHRCKNSDRFNEVGLMRVPERQQSLPSEKISEASTSSLEALQLDDLWNGDPPNWVLHFQELQGVQADILHCLAENFLDCGCPNSFSCVLLHALCSRKIIVPDLPEHLDDSVAFRCCLELLRQYLLTKVSCDLEEVFTTVRVVKRLAREGQFWERISRSIEPSIQEAIRDSYGGTLYNRA